MRDYTLQKLTFVLMAGLPGTGKTTLAAALGETLGCPIIDKDYLKESLLQAPINAITQEELGRAVYEIVFAFAYDILVRQQISVILDTAALYPFILERASNIACVAGAQLKIILCRADINVRNERVRKRKRSIVQPYLNTTGIEDDGHVFKHLPQDTLVLYTARPLKEYIYPTIKYLLA
jgi:predicted kinase